VLDREDLPIIVVQDVAHAGDGARFLVDVIVSIDRYGKWPDLSCRLTERLMDD
jgi:hypothetical protein